MVNVDIEGSRILETTATVTIGRGRTEDIVGNVGGSIKILHFL